MHVFVFCMHWLGWVLLEAGEVGEPQKSTGGVLGGNIRKYTDITRSYFSGVSGGKLSEEFVGLCSSRSGSPTQETPPNPNPNSVFFKYHHQLLVLPLSAIAVPCEGERGK